MDAMSKWFVGSSRSSKCGLTNSARASATRIRHPPDMSFVGRAIICCEKPRPWRIEPALASNVLGSAEAWKQSDVIVPLGHR